MSAKEPGERIERGRCRALGLVDVQQLYIAARLAIIPDEAFGLVDPGIGFRVARDL